jgi:hypothetical protein
MRCNIGWNVPNQKTLANGWNDIVFEIEKGIEPPRDNE